MTSTAASRHVEAGNASSPIIRQVTGESNAVPFPLVLQRRANAAVRRHVAREVFSAATLLGGDIAVLVALHAMLRRFHADWLGGFASMLADAVARLVALPRFELLVAVVLGLVATGTYGSGDRRRDPGAVLGATLIGFGLVSWGHVWQGTSYTLPAFALTAFLLWAGLILERVLLVWLAGCVEHAHERAPRTLVVGAASDARRVLRHPNLNNRSVLTLLGYIDADPTPKPDALGGLHDLVRVIEEQRIETVIFVGYFEEGAFVELLHMTDAAGCQVFTFPRASMMVGFTPQLVRYHGVSLVQLTRPSLRGQQLVLKRTFDAVTSLCVLVLLAPVFIAIALAVRLTSPGPAFFRQVRVGLGGRHFNIFKFRSMVQDAEARREQCAVDNVYGDARLFKVKEDPRITPIGRFLRRTSLDELPQFWNVLRGDMSLVGPRPPLPSEVALYEENHYTRFDMRPGITGPWQASGRNNIVDFNEVIRLETAYLRNWSIWKDVEILLRTIPVVLKMEGAH